jgi:predicted flap endonuclease-1-like 5' DNA nuclease
MATDTATASRSLGGRDALSAYRAERAEARLRLRASLRAGREALRVGRNTPVDPPPAAAPEASATAPEASIFARMVDASIPRTDGASEPVSDDAREPVATDPGEPPEEPVAAAEHDPPDTEAAEVGADANHGAAPPGADAAPAPGLPKDLTAIPELGPGMRIRLSQLGIQSVDDLAGSDPVELRKNLGEISRLLRVERWIETAIAQRQEAATRAA